MKRAAKTLNVPPAEIIGQDEDNVGFRCRWLGGVGEIAEETEEHGEDEEGFHGD
jgi:hypothetical protein